MQQVAGIRDVKLRYKRPEDGMEVRRVPSALCEIEQRPPPHEVRGTAEGAIERRVRDEDTETGIEEHQWLPHGLDNGVTVVGKSGGGWLSNAMLFCGVGSQLLLTRWLRHVPSVRER